MDPLTLATTILGGGAIGAQVFGAIEGNKAQEGILKAQLGQERMLAQRDRLAQVRQLRTQTANVQQAGANTGVSASSSVAGGVGTVYGQVGQNIQLINNQQRFGQIITQDRINYNNAMGIEQLGSDVFNIASKAVLAGL